MVMSFANDSNDMVLKGLISSYCKIDFGSLGWKLKPSELHFLLSVLCLNPVIELT